ncbi:DUF1826 domain-containing protein [Stappia sp.]|uniref:DUF1826 domain-containing protein n=1 Tax=Stappia sp. TaxID=1870903 RepID=UPI0032D8D8B5
MTTERRRIADAAVGVGVATTPDGLATLRKPGCAAVIWQRRPTARVQSWIDALAPDRLPRARVILRPDAVRETVLQICEMCGTPADPARALFVEDVAALTGRFCDLMRTTWVRLRFDVVTTNACRKFHIDAVTARLVCTYRGPGTQYGVSTDGVEPDRIFTVPTGAPILLRGTLWPQKPPSGLLHRSPPIEGTGQTRSVLVLDPVDAPVEPAVTSNGGGAGGSGPFH